MILSKNEECVGSGTNETLFKGKSQVVRESYDRTEPANTGHNVPPVETGHLPLT